MDWKTPSILEVRVGTEITTMADFADRSLEGLSHE
jgi:coenzyme PQQ precursor peptide PqqA